jgi:hypothetical protein
MWTIQASPASDPDVTADYERDTGLDASRHHDLGGALDRSGGEHTGAGGDILWMTALPPPISMSGPSASGE